MAALSAATVVVEASLRSGLMTVARHAHELGRAVGAAPARRPAQRAMDRTSCWNWGLLAS